MPSAGHRFLEIGQGGLSRLRMGGDAFHQDSRFRAKEDIRGPDAWPEARVRRKPLPAQGVELKGHVLVLGRAQHGPKLQVESVLSE